MSARSAAATLVAALALSACEGAATTESRALAYLATTNDELGLDVLVATREYGRLSGDARAEEVVQARLVEIDEGDLERYGVLLEIGVASYPAATLEGVAPPAGAPDPSMRLDDDRDVRCPIEALECAVSDACLEYLALEAWGYVLTHQALALVLARTTHCALSIDVEARRRALAARLVAEMRADPSARDLAFERLAMLGALGFAGAIEPAWIDALRDAQAPEGCFAIDDDLRCHPHPTGLALWVLGLARE